MNVSHADKTIDGRCSRDLARTWCLVACRYATVACLGACLILIVLIAKDSVNAWRLSGYPGPTGLPLIGHVPWLTSAPWMRFSAWAREYGVAYKV